MDQKVILLTGASSGIGKVCASYLASKGHIVYGTSRNGPFPPKKFRDGKPIMIQLDVNDTASIQNITDYIIQQHNHIDVVINNAGIHVGGSIEETPEEKAREQLEANFFGIHKVCRAVLPHMRKQHKGLIINISSIMGMIGLPYQGFYSAAKFALEGMTEALRLEVKHLGINVCLVQPGDVCLEEVHHRWKTPLTSESEYYSDFTHVMKVVEHDEDHGISTEKIAFVLEKIISTKKPRIRYRVASFVQKFAASLKGTIPDRLHQWIIMKYYLPKHKNK